MYDTADPVGAELLVEHLRGAFSQSGELIGRVPVALMDRPTPCPKFDVRTLVGHMVFAADRVAAAGRREPLSENSPAARDVDDTEWGAAFSDAGAQALEAWAVPEAMSGEIVLPFGTFPATAVAQIYALEQATHAWDLAVAVGARSELDEELAEALLPEAQQIILPEYRGPEPMPFAAVIEIDSRAPAYDRLAAFMGRQPEWAA
jgi:uncharacterized protein (TIGR03086 family)